MGRRRRKYRLTQWDKKILKQFREAVDRGDLVETYNRMMTNLMSDRILQLPGVSPRSEQHISGLRLSVAIEITNLANAVAAQKDLDLSFMPMLPDIIFDSGVRT